MHSASASGSAGGTNSPVRPASTNSGLPPTAVAITGRPLAIASKIVFEMPSASDGRTNISSPRRIAGTSRRSPGSHASFKRPAASRTVRASESKGPSPTRTKRKRSRWR